jgi:hypothetical protein
LAEGKELAIVVVVVVILQYERMQRIGEENVKLCFRLDSLSLYLHEKNYSQ